MNYYWIRIFDYKYDDALKEFTEDWEIKHYKGVLLDEYYLMGEDLKREEVKIKVKEKSNVEKFAKPKNKKDGVYALIMESDKYYYDRFSLKIKGKCFNCYCNIEGRAKDFPYIEHEGEKYYFCSYKCKEKTHKKINPYIEGEFQEREDYSSNGGVYGYIYHIFNRKTGMHYIGQTIYMPFFRWQEHVKSNTKGDITDLVFDVITEIRVKDQEYVNNIEAWWINKFIDQYGRDKVMNVNVPKLTINDLIKEYSEMVGGQLFMTFDE